MRRAAFQHERTHAALQPAPDIEEDLVPATQDELALEGSFEPGMEGLGEFGPPGDGGARLLDFQRTHGNFFVQQFLSRLEEDPGAVAPEFGPSEFGPSTAYPVSRPEEEPPEETPLEPAEESGPVSRSEEEPLEDVDVLADYVPEPLVEEADFGQAEEAAPQAAPRELSSWRSAQRARVSAIETPQLESTAEEQQAIAAGGDAAVAARTAGRDAIPGELEAAVSKAPETPEGATSRPAEPDPIPDENARIDALSNLKLPSQPLPAMGVSPQGSVPRMGRAPRPEGQMRILTGTPEVVEAAGLSAKDTEAYKQLRKQMLETRTTPTVEEGEGEPIVLEDRGPPVTPPLPEAVKTQLAGVIARLLADTGQQAIAILTQVRSNSYEGGVLQREYPELGNTELGSEMAASLDTELRAVADAAGVAAGELDAAIEQRRADVAQQSQMAMSLMSDTAFEGQQAMCVAGQEELDAIAGTSQATQEDIENRQAAASGHLDPAAVERRRDRLSAQVRQRVTEQMGNYAEAGRVRSAELTGAEEAQADAYRFVAQQDDLALRETAADPHSKEIERLANASRAWAEDRIVAVHPDFVRMKAAAAEISAGYQREVEAAGKNAVAALIDWAYQITSEQRDWWDDLMARIRAWIAQAQVQTETWEAARTRQTQAAILNDLRLVQGLQVAAENGISEETIRSTNRLNAEEDAVATAFFNGPTDPLGAVAAGIAGRLARDWQPRLVPKLERMIIDRPFDEWKKVHHIGQAQSPGFNGDELASKLHRAMYKIGTDESAIFEALANLTPVQVAAIRKIYRAKFGDDLDEDLGEELSGDEYQRADDLMQSQQAAADAAAIHEAISGIGTDESAIMTVLRNRSPEHREKTARIYKERYGEWMDDALASDLSGEELERAQALRAGDIKGADAIALHTAMRTGPYGLGDAEAAEGVYSTIRNEVKAQADAEEWSPARMNAEIERRNREVEGDFDVRYAEEYEGAPLGAFRTAVATRYFGPEKDLITGLADNDRAKVYAAKIRIEEKSVVYASDKKINAALRAQYEEALDEVQRGVGRDRRNALLRAMNKEEMAAQEQGTPWTPEMRIDRELAIDQKMRHENEEAAKTLAKRRMGTLDALYSTSYGHGLSTVVENNVSGDDLDKSRDMLAQGGYLTFYQQVDYAVRGAGTEEEELKQAVDGRTPDEIEKAKKLWKDNKGEEMVDRLNSELSGRDQFDIVTMGLQGAPQTARQQVEQLRQRQQHEIDDLGVFGGAAARHERAWMIDRMADLDATAAHLGDNNLSIQQRRDIVGEFHENVDLVDRAIEDHRAGVDYVANMAAMVVGTIVGLAVGILSFGTLGPVGAAIIGSIYGTLYTMATKASIMGGAYGPEEMGIDAAIGVVDALSSWATAGMGGRLLGQTVRTGASLAPRATTLLGRLKALQTGPFANLFSGQGRLARMAASKSLAMRTIARGAAETGEAFIGAVPTAAATTLSNDELWESGSFSEGFSQFAEQTVISTGTSLLFQGGMAARRRLPGLLRGRAGRFQEHVSQVRSAWNDFHERNPNASYRDFLETGLGMARPTADQQAEMARVLEGDAAATTVRPSGDEGLTPARPQREVEAPQTGAPQTAGQKLIRFDPSLDPGTVEVRFDPNNFGNVHIAVGPRVRPIDVLLHIPTARAVNRLSGVLGRARQLLARIRAFLARRPYLPPGSTAGHADMEVQKIIGLIEVRAEAIRSGGLDPLLHAELSAEIDNFSRQIDQHQQAIDNLDLSPGSGVIAGRGRKKAPTELPSEAVEADAPKPSISKTKAQKELRGIRREIHELEGRRIELEAAEPSAVDRSRLFEINARIDDLRARAKPLEEALGQQPLTPEGARRQKEMVDKYLQEHPKARKEYSEPNADTQRLLDHLEEIVGAEPDPLDRMLAAIRGSFRDKDFKTAMVPALRKMMPKNSMFSTQDWAEFQAILGLERLPWKPGSGPDLFLVRGNEIQPLDLTSRQNPVHRAEKQADADALQRALGPSWKVQKAEDFYHGGGFSEAKMLAELKPYLLKYGLKSTP